MLARHRVVSIDDPAIRRQAGRQHKKKKKSDVDYDDVAYVLKKHHEDRKQTP